ILPAERAACIEPASINSSYEMISALMNPRSKSVWITPAACGAVQPLRIVHARASFGRSEEHTSELQSRFDLVCRLLPEKKKGPLLKFPGQRIDRIDRSRYGLNQRLTRQCNATERDNPQRRRMGSKHSGKP